MPEFAWALGPDSVLGPLDFYAQLCLILLPHSFLASPLLTSFPSNITVRDNVTLSMFSESAL